ncbi:uncharacterized protein LOC117780924 isoform X2 [Drosophila innubila]|uniref:uncharacterized protein LOC117780924 isoform X2 n=1 Tax=Drosophila innubila TaxID=198719 RepID=UPI00148D75E0|nr:uncharacterized protein LOC117780924 isoform X2 [Drosophila innubila]
MVKMKKFCFCVPLKWGMLIIAIFDTILDVLGLIALHFVYLKDKNLGDNLLFMCIPILHFVGCILLAVSFWVRKKDLVLCYLFTGIWRIVFVICIMIPGIANWWLLVTINHLVIFIVGIFFMACVLFWYYELEEQK